MESPLRIAVQLIKAGLLIVGILVGFVALEFAIAAYRYSIPDADMTLRTMGADTTFSVGKAGGPDRSGCYLSVRATGEADDSTAAVYVEYPSHPSTVISGHLPRGKFDRVWSSDFYESEAKIRFVHNGVKRGKLRLQFTFRLPPPAWKVVWANGYQAKPR